jgi:hypothetical protein
LNPSPMASRNTNVASTVASTRAIHRMIFKCHPDQDTTDVWNATTSLSRIPSNTEMRQTSSRPMKHESRGVGNQESFALPLAQKAQMTVLSFPPLEG